MKQRFNHFIMYSATSLGLLYGQAGAAATLTSAAPMIVKSASAQAQKAGAFAMPTGPVAANKIPAYVYKGAGCTGLAALGQYQAVIGRKVDGVTDFLDGGSTWPNLVNETNWALGCWQGNVSNVDVSLPMVVAQNDGSGLPELAAGRFDAYLVQVAQSLVSHGFPNAYIRVGWEFNGGWYPWTATSSPSTWVKGYRDVVSAMRSVQGQNFKFVWNPSLGEGQFWPDEAYPGDDVVDVIATDAYNQSWDPGYLQPASLWNSVDNDSWGVAQVISFAKQHGKPVAFPEWGTGTRPDGHGGGDDPLFIANMAASMAATTVAYQSYWDYPASDYNAQLSNGQYPAALAAFMAAFGATTAGTASTTPAVRKMGDIVTTGVTATALTAAATKALPVVAAGCSEATVQTAAQTYELFVWNSPSATASSMKKATVNTRCQLTWNLQQTVKVYDPSVGTSPINEYGKIKTTTVAIPAGKPLVLVLGE